MSMNEFRRLAAKIDQHMQQLAAQGVSEVHAIINRMMGYGGGLTCIGFGSAHPTSSSWRCPASFQGFTVTPALWKRRRKPSANNVTGN